MMPRYINHMNAARVGPHVTCGASRHVAMMAEALAVKGSYPMISEDPKHCAESLAAVVAALWDARRRLHLLERTG